jgi:hypothetical protein
MHPGDIDRFPNLHKAAPLVVEQGSASHSLYYEKVRETT